MRRLGSPPCCEPLSCREGLGEVGAEPPTDSSSLRGVGAGWRVGVAVSCASEKSVPEVQGGLCTVARSVVLICRQQPCPTQQLAWPPAPAPTPHPQPSLDVVEAEVRLAGPLDELVQPKVGQLGVGHAVAAARQQHVFSLQVAVDDLCRGGAGGGWVAGCD